MLINKGDAEATRSLTP